jgi:hypothetical protein
MASLEKGEGIECEPSTTNCNDTEPPNVDETTEEEPKKTKPACSDEERQTDRIKESIEYREWHARLKDNVFESKFIPLEHAALDFLCKGDISDLSNSAIEGLIASLDAQIEELGGDVLVRLNIASAEDAVSDFEKLSSEEKDRFRVQIINQVELERQLVTANVCTRRGTFTRKLVSESDDDNPPKNLPRSALEPETEDVTYETLSIDEPPEAVVLRAFSRVCAQRMRVSSGKDALCYLASSSHVRYRLNQLHVAEGTWESGLDVYVVIQQWMPALSRFPGMHLRGFVYQNSLNALSQINDSAFFPNLVQHKKTIQQRVEAFFKDVVSKSLEDVKNYVVDFFVSPKSIVVTDVLPFDKSTGACLFTWRENELLFRNGPLEFRVYTLPAEGCLPSLPSQWENELMQIVAELKKLSQREDKSCVIL